MTENSAKVRNFPCKGCGATIEFNPGAQDLKCPHCGHEEKIPMTREEIREFALEERFTRPKPSGPKLEGRSIQCERCGATFQVADTALSSACAYCGSPVAIQDAAASDRVEPEAILPFKLDKPQAIEAFKSWVRGLWFAPTSLRKEGLAQRLQGVYRPYWTFDAFTANHFRGDRGDDYYVTVGSGNNRRTVRETRWSFVSGEFTRFFDDVLVSAGRQMSWDTEFMLPQCKPFTPEYASGYSAESYSIEPEDGWTTAKEKITRELISDASARIGGDRQRNVSVETAYSRLTFKLVLLPLYIGTFEYHGKMFQIQVNGETGQTSGQRPYSAWKITLAVLIGIAAAILLLWLINR